jgi:hypothetical protein
MEKIKIRLSVAFNILFGRYKHWAVLNISRDDLGNLVTDKPFDVDIAYHGIQPYIYYKMVKKVANSKSDIDMILGKADFEANAILLQEKNKNNL